jgi:hypothetical protein
VGKYERTHILEKINAFDSDTITSDISQDSQNYKALPKRQFDQKVLINMDIILNI